MLYLEDLKRATPSVLIWKLMWISLFFFSSDAPLKNPSFPKWFLQSSPSWMSSMASGLLLLLVTGYLRRSRMPVSSQVKSLMLSVRVIYHSICSRTPVTWTHITLTPPLNQTTCTIKLPFSSELTSLFSHFYLVNSNSDNSNSSLTQTVAFFFWSKFTRSLEFWFLQQLSPMPTEISH